MCDPIRILVTGSRDWPDNDAIPSAILPHLPCRGSHQDTAVLVHGACPTGADALASDWWLANGGLEERHPADWSKHGRAAGPIRNKQMVELGADVCYAFIRKGSKGATHCADLAEKAGIPTLRITLDD